jgi:DNA-directed RNA polymerase subunit E'/Rpb7
MFMPIKFNTTIILTPNELNKNFEATIIAKIKATLENSCSKHGYIKRDSIKIIKRSPGYIKEAHFNGNIAYDLNCIAEICNPAQDSIIKCVVKAKNNLGLLAIGKYEEMAILEVIIPKITSGILSDVNIDNINIGDEVNVIVCGKKFTLYDKMISIIGRIIKDKVSDDISVIEEDEDDSPSIDDEDADAADGAADDQDLYGADDLLNGDDDLYDDAEADEDDEVDNVRKIIIDEDGVGSSSGGGVGIGVGAGGGASGGGIGGSKTKSGEFSMFENDDDIEEDEEEEEEEEDELDDDLDDAEEDVDEDLDFGGDDYE